MGVNIKLISIVTILVAIAWVAVFLTFNSSETGAPGLDIPLVPVHRYRFVLIAQASESSYWHQVLQGMRPLIQREQIALEFYSPNPSRHSEVKHFLEKAVLTGYDGILLTVPNHPDFRALLNVAADRDIPMVWLANAPDSSRFTYVGVSPYDLGFQTGKALQKLITEPTKAVLLRDSNNSATNNRQYLNGLHAGLGAESLLQISLIVNSNGKNVRSDEQTRAIIQNYPEIRTFICSNPSDTLRVAKTADDLNTTSRMTILGTGLTPEIANYLRRNIIRGVLADDPVALGVQGLTALLHLKTGRSLQESPPLPLYWVDSQNLDQHLLKGRQASYSSP